ncbi:MAG: hypothetical protein ACLVJ6_06935 [Merdibacter sp.]
MLAEALAQAKEEEVRPHCTHPCNMYRMARSDDRAVEPTERDPGQGRRRTDNDTTYALELNVKVPCKNKDYYIYTEETVLLDEMV